MNDKKLPISNLALTTFIMIACGLVQPRDAFAQRDLTDIPKPDPVAERAQMQVHELAAVNLFAADPDISKPIQMNFDCDGNLWIASSEVYPQIRPGEVANDKIIVLRDTDGDGKADKRTVFADGLLIPTGVLPDGPNAAYVVDSTRLLYMQDTDGDGKSDQQEIILSGFGTEDTHHLAHTLRFGPDGCIYFNQSIYIHSHFDTPDGPRRLDGGGIWRFRPKTNELEILCKGFINPWGHQFDSSGESFVTDGAFFEGINYVFPNSIFVTSPGATRWVRGMNPGSPKHCGLEILSGTHVPEDWRGMMVTNDFRSHRVCRFEVKPSGATYLSRQKPEIITTQHVAFRPIDARMGPDGALYIADWYNPIIQHGEVDFRDERRDRKHGRIWRVSFPDRDLDPWPDFDKATTPELISMLEDPALPVRQFSRQELWERLDQDSDSVFAAMLPWIVESPPTRVLEGLWLAESLEEVDGAALARLVDAFEIIDPARKRTVLRSLWRLRDTVDNATTATSIEDLALRLTAHDDDRVRLEAVVCAGQLASTDALTAVLAASELETNEHTDFAIWQSLRSIDQNFQASDDASHSILASMDWTDASGRLATAIKAIASQQAAQVGMQQIQSVDAQSQKSELVAAIAETADAEQLGMLTESILASASDGATFRSLAPLRERTAHDGTIPANVNQRIQSAIGLTEKSAEAVANELMSSPSEAMELAELTRAWKLASLEPVLVQLLEKSMTVKTSDAPTSKRLTSKRLISAIGSLESASAKSKIEQLATSEKPDVRVAATAAIAAKTPGRSVPFVVDLLADEATFESASDLFGDLAKRKFTAKLLSEAIKKTSLPPDNARELIRVLKSAGGNEEIEAAIRESGKLAEATWKWSAELSDELSALVKSSGDPAEGESIYRRKNLQCIQCHAIGTAGGLVGPNLISIGGSAQVDYILESLLAPNAKLKEGYTSKTILTDDGRVISGIVIGETDEALKLRLADGKEINIPADSIEDERPGKSLMPEGLVDELTRDELVNLASFLSAMGRDPSYVVSTDPIVRGFDSLVYSNEANRRLNRTSTDTVAGDDPLMVWRSETTLVSGDVPTEELDRFKQHRGVPPTSFVRFQVKMPSDGTAKIETPTDGIEAWVDGKPTPIWDLKNLKLPEGEHKVVLSIDHSRITSGFKIRIGGDAAL